MAGKTPETSIAKEVRERVLRSRDRIWHIEDFDGSPKAVRSELSRLIARGELRRVRRGVYYRGRRSRFGMLSVDDSKAVKAVVGDDEAIGATGWNATNVLGLSTQVAPAESLAITHRSPEGLGRVKIASRSARTGRRKAGLSGLEVTVLEALEGWERYVELDAESAVRRFGQILGWPDLRVARLVAASVTEPPVVRERLRAVLAATGHQEAADQVTRARDPRTQQKALRVLKGAA